MDRDTSATLIAPFGTWESEITKEAVCRGTRTISSPRVCPRISRAFFCESRPDGAIHILEIKEGGECKDVLPDGYSARSRVYEYGGAPYAILPGARIIFSNFSDNSVNVVGVDSGDVKCLLYGDSLRYGDFNVHPGDQPWVLAIEEDHTIDFPEKVKNYVVAINTTTGDVKRLVEGADFYMSPSFSHDGKSICWVQWDFPDMPWSGATLHLAAWENGALGKKETVAGESRKSVTEPRWGPDGCLYFGWETENCRKLYRRLPDGRRELIQFDDDQFRGAEFGRATMGLGSHSFTFLSDRLMLVAYLKFGRSGIALYDLQGRKVKDLTSLLGRTHCEVSVDGVERRSDKSCLAVVSWADRAQTLDEICVETRISLTLRSSIDQDIQRELLSRPKHITFHAKNKPKREIHGFFWHPQNPKFKGPPRGSPPLIVVTHGGPTSHTGPGLKPDFQYWTSRGYAIFAINYSGSSAHGKEYRESLNGNWGVLDVDDVAECVRYLTEMGSVDSTKVGIRGGSAGGYSVLQSLCRYPEIFAGGVCLYGISDVKLLLGTTHKMESRYVAPLMFKDGMTDEEKETVMLDRSPVHQAGKITAPLLMIHGEDDNVVPISQAYTMYDDIKKRGGDVELVKFPGEGHGFRQAENQLRALEEEEKWWRKTLVRV